MLLGSVNIFSVKNEFEEEFLLTVRIEAQKG